MPGVEPLLVHFCGDFTGTLVAYGVALPIVTN
jgi:hypothetical protein